jgi:hypothetical protein
MKVYLFRGEKIKATSKDVILRRFGLKVNAKTKAAIIKLKKTKKG